MEYWRFDPSSCGFPAALLPMLPPLHLPPLSWAPRPGRFRRLDAGQSVIFFTRARYALLEAYRRAGVGPAGALLAPAYHCRTMLDPAIHLGAPIQLYPLSKRLEPELASLRQCIEQSPLPVKALLLPHFFGFGQETLAPIRALCIELGLSLIEDCSHLLISGAEAEAALGATGHFTVASPYKFFGSSEGGLLWAAGQTAPARAALATSPWREWRALLRAASAARQAGHSPARLEKLKPFPVAPSSAALDCDRSAIDSQTSSQFCPEEAGLRGAPWARWVMQRSDLEALAERRRANYQRLLDTVAELPHCRALFPALPGQAVPYMFPLHINKPDPHFFQLKRLGVPVGRWDDLAASACPVAVGYRLHLIHLPCHQALSELQMDWMCRALELTLRAPTEQ